MRPNLARTRSTRVAALDGFRGISILLIVVRHATTLTGVVIGITWIDTAWQAVVPLLIIGMDFFFTLSGFLISEILLSTRQDPRYFQNFYLRRFFRIVPLHLVFLIAVYGSLRWSSAAVTEHWGWFLSFLTNFKIMETGHFVDVNLNHLWSLAVEEQVYLVWPILLCAIAVPKLRWLSVIGILGAPLLRAEMVRRNFPLTTISVFTLARIDSFCAGLWLASLRRQGKKIPEIHLMIPWGALILVIGYVSVPTAYFQGVILFSSGTIIALGAIGVALREETGLSKHKFAALLAAPGLVTLGRYSYFIYLFHQPVFATLGPPLIRAVQPVVVSGFLASFIVGTALFLPLFVLAHFSYRFFEGPILDYKDKNFRRMMSFSKAGPVSVMKRTRANLQRK